MTASTRPAERRTEPASSCDRASLGPVEPIDPYAWVEARGNLRRTDTCSLILLALQEGGLTVNSDGEIEA